MTKGNNHRGRCTISSIEPLESRIAPATFTVTTLADSGAGSLRNALHLADTNPGADTINFHLSAAAPGTENTITLLSELTTTGNVTIDGPGAGKLIINGNQKDRVLDITDGSATTNSPVTITGLSFVNGLTTGHGGGIFSTESLTLNNVVVTGNTALDGGGVAVGHDAQAHIHVKISNSQISGNTASASGGGLDLYDLDSLTLSKTVITGNSTVSKVGGGVYAALNSTAKGLSINGCVVSHNSAKTGGGGIFLYTYALGPSVKMTISASDVTGNSATYGGGVYVETGNAVISGTKISGNTGAGVYVAAGNTAISSSQISSNNGIGVEAHENSSLAISKSSITGNLSVGVFIRGSSSATLLTATITGTTIAGNVSSGLGAGLYARGGVSLTVSGSTFDANRASLEGGGLAAVGTGVNKTNVTVTKSIFSGNTASDGGGFYAYGDGAVTMTNCTVTGNNAVTGGGIFLTSLTNPVVTGVAVSGNTAITDGGGLDLSVVSGFKITGGSFNNNAVTNSGSVGGGIEIINSTGIISNASILDNTAVSNGGGIYGFNIPGVTIIASKISGNVSQVGSGGGIFANGATLSILNTAVSNNTAFNGGGFYAHDLGSFTINGGSFTGNAAIDGAGIGIGSTVTGQTGSISGVSITGNAAEDIGGGVFNTGSHPAAITLQIAKVIANTAVTDPDVAGPDITFVA